MFGAHTDWKFIARGAPDVHSATALLLLGEGGFSGKVELKIGDGAGAGFWSAAVFGRFGRRRGESARGLAQSQGKPQSAGGTRQSRCAMSRSVCAMPDRFAATPHRFAATPQSGTATAHRFAAMAQSGNAMPHPFAAMAHRFAAVPPSGTAIPHPFAAVPPSGTALPCPGEWKVAKSPVFHEKRPLSRKTRTATQQPRWPSH